MHFVLTYLLLQAAQTPSDPFWKVSMTMSKFKLLIHKLISPLEGNLASNFLLYDTSKHHIYCHLFFCFSSCPPPLLLTVIQVCKMNLSPAELKYCSHSVHIFFDILYLILVQSSVITLSIFYLLSKNPLHTYKIPYCFTMIHQ